MSIASYLHLFFFFASCSGFFVGCFFSSVRALYVYVYVFLWNDEIVSLFIHVLRLPGRWWRMKDGSRGNEIFDWFFFSSDALTSGYVLFASRGCEKRWHAANM